MKYIFQYMRKNFTLPNIISLIRIVLICPFVAYTLENDYIKSGIILSISGISDLLDGFIARKYNQMSSLGKMLDPVADKLTLIAFMVCVGLKFQEIVPFVIVLIVKELLMILASAFLLKKHKIPPSAKWYGKIATMWFYCSAIAIMTLKFVWGIQNSFLTFSSMLVTVLLMLYAFIRYLKIFLDIVKSSKTSDNSDI